MRALLFLSAMLVAAGCAPQFQHAPRPAFGAIPESCEATMWVLDQQCRHSTYYRCDQGPEDRIFIEERLSQEEIYIHERRSHGLIISAISQPGGEWREREVTNPGDPAAMLAGRASTVAASYLVDGEPSEFSIRYQATGDALALDGIGLPQFDGQGEWHTSAPEPWAIDTELFYVEAVGLFIKGRSVFTGPSTLWDDGVPLRLSLAGPITDHCVPAQ